MQLTIYYKIDDNWLIEKLESKAYGDRMSVSKVILTILDQYFTAQSGNASRPPTPRARKKPGPKPGGKRRSRARIG